MNNTENVSAIQRLNEKICEEYKIEVNCDRSHILDTYDQGEEEEVNWKSNFYSSSRESTTENIGGNIKEMVEYVLKTYTQFSSFEEYYEDNWNYDDNYFIIYQNVNKDCSEPSETEVELWKKGELDLFAQYTHIKIRVNSALLDVSMIQSLIEMEKK